MSPSCGHAGSFVDLSAARADALLCEALQAAAGQRRPGSTRRDVNRPLTGLAPGATYHSRVIATGPDGTTDGADTANITPATSMESLRIRNAPKSLR